MGKWKALLPILLALVIATGGSMFLYRWLQAKTADAEAIVIEKDADTVPIVVAAVDMPWGTKLTDEMVETVSFLKESLPEGYHLDPKALVGRVLIAPVKQKEPILGHKLAPEDVTMGGVSAIVKPGMRAIAVKGDKVIGISGFIQPGNRVDVLVTLQDPKTKSDATKLVLENVLVLATGTEIEDKANGKPGPVDVYTLEVNPEQGEKLSLASTKGKLQFALRNVMDTEPVFTRGATIPSTLASLRRAAPQPAEAPTRRPAPSHVIVEVIKGGKVTQEKLKL